MPAKQRVSKMRNALITPEAIKLFRRGCNIIKHGDQNFEEEDGGRATEYRDICRRLHWQLLDCAAAVGPLDIEEGDYADVPDSEIVNDGTWRSTVPHARQLHRLLKKGMRK
jgi:hypothetical protein